MEDIDFITEGLVVGQDFDDDVRIILFVTTKNDQEIDEILKEHDEDELNDFEELDEDMY